MRTRLLFAIFLIKACSALVLSGTIQADNNMQRPVFLQRFCFSNEGNGIGSAKLHYKSKTAGTFAIFFDDEMWDKTKEELPHMACKQILTAAGYEGPAKVGTYVQPLLGKGTAQFGVGDYVRPHQWYAFIINCEGKIDLEYKMIFLNEMSGWQRQFSFDMQGVLIGYGMFSLLCTILTIWHWYAHSHAAERKNEACNLPTVHLVRWALLVFTLGNAFWLVHMILYSHDGVGIVQLSLAGEIFNIIAETIVLAVLLLIAQGWTVLYIRIKHKTATIAAILAYVLSHVLFLIWTHCCFDQSKTGYAFESFAGAIRLVTQLGLCLFFLYLIARSLSEESPTEAKMRFYTWFALGGTLWFAVVPVAVIIAGALAGYLRAKAVIYMRLVIEFLTILGLMYAVWPTRAAEIFQVQHTYSVLTVTDFDDI